MFFTSISKFCSSWHFSAVFKSTDDYFGAELPILVIACTNLVVFTEFSSLIIIIVALTACVIACIIICSAVILFFVLYLSIA